MKNWIELQENIGQYAGMELWKAKVHYGGHADNGWALCNTDCCDWYDGMPGRDIPDEELTNGLRLPAYMPGHRPE